MLEASRKMDYDDRIFTSSNYNLLHLVVYRNETLKIVIISGLGLKRPISFFQLLAIKDFKLKIFYRNYIF